MNLYDSTNSAIVSLLQVKKLEGMRLDSKTQKAAQAEIDTACYAIRELINAVKDNRLDGGPGSGNWGHIGIPGHWGGSQKGGGNAFRLAYTSYATKKTNYEHVEEEYTSQAKIRKQLHDDLVAAKITDSKEAVEKIQKRLSQINDRTKTAFSEEDLRKQGYTDEEIAKKFDVVHNVDKEASKHILETDNTNSTGTRAGGKYARGTAEGVKQTKVKKNSSSKKSEGEDKDKGKSESESENDKDKSNTQNKPSRNDMSETAKTLESNLLARNVTFNEPQKLSEQLQEEAIIDKVTKDTPDTVGYCCSLAMAYVANKQGYDVTDYRSEASRDVFSRSLRGLEKSGTLNGTETYGKTGTESAIKALETMDVGKEYVLNTGRHCSVVRAVATNDGNEKRYEYLELQLKKGNNGWKSFGTSTSEIKNTLKLRFAATKTQTKWYRVYGVQEQSVITPVESFKNNADAYYMFGYINSKGEK